MRDHPISMGHQLGSTPAQSPGDAGGSRFVPSACSPILLFQPLPPTASAALSLALSQGALPAYKPLLISKEGLLCNLLSTEPVPLL